MCLVFWFLEFLLPSPLFSVEELIYIYGAYGSLWFSCRIHPKHIAEKLNFNPFSSFLTMNAEFSSSKVLQ
jgi:hypothetical protein